VKTALTMLVRATASRHRHSDPMHRHQPSTNFYLAGRAAFADAAGLIASFGEAACIEAAARADRSRVAGNVVHFCHWRQIERAIRALRDQDVTGTVH